MAELGPYLSLYEEKVDKTISRTQENLNKWNDRLETYNTLYPEVLKIADDLGILETFQKLFPEGGGRPSFGSQALELSNLYSYGEDSLPIKALDKVANSPQRTVKLANRIEELNQWKGKGEDYLKKLQQSISLKLAKLASTSPNSFDKLMSMTFSEYDTYKNVVDFSDIEIDGPRGVKSSEITYALLKEKYESGEYSAKKKETEEDKDQISNNTAIGNDIEEDIDEADGLESLAINSDAEPDTLDENTTLDESSIDAETVGTDVKTTQEALSLPKEVEQPESKPEVPVEIASPINQEVEIKKPVEEVIETKPGPLNDTESPQEAVAQDLETGQSPITQPENAPVEQVDAQPLSIPKAESPIVAESTVSPIGNEKPKKASLFKRLKKSLSQGGGAISNISNIINSTGDFLQDGSVSNLISNIKGGSNVKENIFNNKSLGPLKNIKDQIKSKKDEVLNKESSVSNLSETFLNQDLSKIGDVVKNTNLGGAVSNTIDKSSSFSSFPKSEIIKPEPITKADISEVGENISTNVSSSISSSPQVQESTNDSIEISSGRKERKEARQEARQDKKAEKQAARGMGSINNDFSSMEKRLKNIELLLMGPLEVKIKN